MAKDKLRAAVQEEIDMICLGAPNAVVECKKLVGKAAEARPLDEAFREMEAWSRSMFQSADGRKAWRLSVKRKPRWVKAKSAGRN